MILLFLTIYTIAYAIRNLSGPFNSFDWFRRKIVGLEYGIGLFCYQLLSCPWCLGFWIGLMCSIVFLPSMPIMQHFLWGFAGSFIAAFFDIVFDILYVCKERLISNDSNDQKTQ